MKAGPEATGILEADGVRTLKEYVRDAGIRVGNGNVPDVSYYVVYSNGGTPSPSPSGSTEPTPTPSQSSSPSPVNSPTASPVPTPTMTPAPSEPVTEPTSTPGTKPDIEPDGSPVTGLPDTAMER